tara:strand:- start:87 stop:293 length:207 start_codon:yes stop_codon:yes gene_type:complete
MSKKERIDQLEQQVLELRKQNYQMANLLDMLVDMNASGWQQGGAIANMKTMQKIMNKNASSWNPEVKT